jgi:hypothetical protein
MDRAVSPIDRPRIANAVSKMDTLLGDLPGRRRREIRRSEPRRRCS